VQNKLRFWLFRKIKHLKFRLLSKPTTDILLIMGCQRSGTSMLMRTFDWHGQTKVYRELSEVFDDMRLIDDKKVFDHFNETGAPMVVAKPLLDSQKFQHYLDLDQRIKVLWPYRHYKSVAKSNLRKFGNNNGKRDLSFITENHPTDWRNEFVSESDRELVKRLLDSGISDLDAAALFWYLRNKLITECRDLNLMRIKCIKYETITQQPSKAFSSIFRFLNQDIESLKLEEIHTNPKSSKKAIELNEEIEQLCQGVYEQIEQLAAQSFPELEN